MGWFTRKQTDGTTADDGMNALDRLTQKASVGLSRRSFLKKTLPAGAAVGLGIAGLAAGSSVVFADEDCRFYGNRCGGESITCVSCSGGQKTKKTYYRKFECPSGSCTLPDGYPVACCGEESGLVSPPGRGN